MKKKSGVPKKEKKGEGILRPVQNFLAPPGYKFDWRTAIYGAILLLCLGIIWSVIGPHPEVYFVINRIYFPGVGDIHVGPVETVVDITDGQRDYLYWVSNPKNISFVSVNILFPDPSSFTAMNQSYYRLTIYNKGSDIANTVDIDLASTYPMRVLSSPSEFSIKNGSGAYSNDLHIFLDHLGAGESKNIDLTSDEVVNVTPTIYLNNQKVVDSRVLILDSVLIPYIPNFMYGNCEISVPRLSTKYSESTIERLVFIDEKNCKYEWQPATQD